MPRLGRSLVALCALGACAPDGQEELGPEDLAPEIAREIHPIILGRPGPNGSPQWRAVIEPGRLLLDSPTSAGWYAIALPPPRQEAAPRRLTYVAGTTILTMELGACTIAAYRARLDNRATLEWDGGRFDGCTGPGLFPASIGGTYWELMRIGSEAAPEGRSPPAILFLGRDGSRGGTLACNDGGIRTRWTQAGEFVAGPPGFEQTAMGCNDPAVEAFGTRFWQGLMTARSWRRQASRLRIIFTDGTEAELRFLLPDQMSSVSRP